jgi:hypothetical protein
MHMNDRHHVPVNFIFYLYPKELLVTTLEAERTPAHLLVCYEIPYRHFRYQPTFLIIKQRIDWYRGYGAITPCAPRP